MSWTPADAIGEAREYHPAFDKRQTTDGAARRLVDTYHRELYGKVIDRDSTFFSTDVEIELPIAAFDDGEALPVDFDYWQGGEVFYEGSDFTDDLNLVPYASRHAPGNPNAVYIREQTLYFVGEEEDWNVVDKVEIHYAPTPTDLATLSTVADLPDRALPAVVERVALFMAGRGPQDGGGTPIDIQLTMSDWRDTERQFLHEISRRSRAEQSYVREVW